jgi:hypothetical protein
MTAMGAKYKQHIRRRNPDIGTFLNCKVEQPERCDQRIEHGEDEKNVNHEQMIRKPISKPATGG